MPALPLSPEQLEDAQRLRNIWELFKRAQPNMTQDLLAEACGWKTQGSVSQYMHGRIPLNLPAILKFARALGVDPEDISPTLALQLQVNHKKRTYEAAKLVEASRATDASGPPIAPARVLTTPAQTLFDLRRLLRNHTPTRRTICADALRNLALDPDNDELSDELATLLTVPLAQTNKQFAT